GHSYDGARADQRHQLHLHRDGQQRQRQRAGLRTVQRRNPEYGAWGADGGDGDPRQRVGDRELDRAEQWRQRDHQLYGDAVHRLGRADAGEGGRETGRDRDDGAPGDQRHQLHLHRDGDHRQGHRGGVLAVERGHARRANGSRGTDGGDRERGQHRGGGELDRAG